MGNEAVPKTPAPCHEVTLGCSEQLRARGRCSWGCPASEATSPAATGEISASLPPTTASQPKHPVSTDQSSGPSLAGGFVPTPEGCCPGSPAGGTPTLQRSRAIRFFNAASRPARSRQPGPSRVLPASCEEFEALGGAAGSAAQPGLAQHQGTSPSPVGIQQLTASAETLPLVPPGWNWEHSTARLTQQRERLRPT